MFYTLSETVQFKFFLWSESMEDIYATSKPFLVFAKVVGLVPFSVQVKKKKFLKTKWQDLFAVCLSFATLIGLIFLKLSPTNKFRSDSSILQNAWEFMVISGLFQLLIQFFFQIANRKVIRKFLETLNNFDQDVSKKSHLF